MEKDYGKVDAKRLIRECGSKLGLAVGDAELATLRKGDERKTIQAALFRRCSGGVQAVFRRCSGGVQAVSAKWIARRPPMGHPGSVSLQVSIVKRDWKLRKQVDELEKM